MTTTAYRRRTDQLREQIERASTRYEERAEDRERTRQVLHGQGVLYADTPERVTTRLARLGADWSQATAMEATPRLPTTGSSLSGLAPENFGTDMLGLERLMGRNDLIDVRFLESGYLAARSVGRVVVRGPEAHVGTGFLTSPSLMLTNNHVLADPQEAERGVIEFNYQAGVDGRTMTPIVFDLEPGRFFVTDRDLDFTLVAVADRGRGGESLKDISWLPLSEAQGKVILGEMVNIIQHPNGEPKQLALRENEVVDLLEDFVHYSTDTAPGSSGSPVYNDQWEVVALHHAGVPLKDADGRFLSVDGSLWRPEMGESRLAWKANEGVRISRVLQAVRQAAVSGPAGELRAGLFEGVAAAPAATVGVGVAPETPSPSTNGRAGSTATVGAVGAVEADGASRVTVPVDVVVTVQPRTAASAPPTAAPVGVGVTPGAPPAATVIPVNGHVSPAEADLRAGLTNLDVGRERLYFDADANRVAREAYYAGLDGAGRAELGPALTDLLERTHERKPAYKPMRMLYPWVDLHPDKQLRSIYSGQVFAPEEFIRADAAVETARIQRWQELAFSEAFLGGEALAAEMEALEAALAFNCEHVVPQSWFAKREPMRGDLHHLFACETTCNSFRSNIPYFDFTDPEEVSRGSCGRRERQGFEPSAGKGPVARATLYFILRYPGLVGDADAELQPDQLATLVDWHEADPVGLYEQHRNFAIAEIQGNRNPLVDHQEWARAIDFAHAWS
ncbi:endonuclease [Streptomyces europaeiscabiei]|uniref:endonuclease n=1 Tax=Streptomyces europaeiscabiei TaxID=146819 RepID=UPI002E14E62F|nr:endonuclease [Streptomyces europaeiscabiei]